MAKTFWNLFQDGSLHMLPSPTTYRSCEIHSGHLPLASWPPHHRHVLRLQWGRTWSHDPAWLVYLAPSSTGLHWFKELSLLATYHAVVVCFPLSTSCRILYVSMNFHAHVYAELFGSLMALKLIRVLTVSDSKPVQSSSACTLLVHA